MGPKPRDRWILLSFLAHLLEYCNNSCNGWSVPWSYCTIHPRCTVRTVVTKSQKFLRFIQAMLNTSHTVAKTGSFSSSTCWKIAALSQTRVVWAQPQTVLAMAPRVLTSAADSFHLRPTYLRTYLPACQHTVVEAEENAKHHSEENIQD